MRVSTLFMSLACASALSLASCKKEEAAKPEPAKPAAADAAAPAGGGGTGGGGGEPGPGGHGSGTGGGTGGGGSAGAGGSGKMENKMANCPSAVVGAETAIAETKDGVEVTVTSKDKAATDEIRKRAAKQVEAAKMPSSAEIKHTGTGSGGGEIGYCPVVLGDTTVESADVDGGVKLTVKPAKPEGLAALVAETKRRKDNMPSGDVPNPVKPEEKPAEKAPPK